MRLWIFVGALLIAACAPEHEAAERAVSELTRDPSAVQFRGISVSDTGAICGEFNATNEFGGYQGFMRFVIVDGEVQLDPGAEGATITPGRFDELFRWQCELQTNDCFRRPNGVEVCPPS